MKRKKDNAVGPDTEVGKPGIPEQSQPDSPGPKIPAISRRRFITSGTGAAAAILASGATIAGAQKPAASGTGSHPRHRAQAKAPFERFSQPPVIDARQIQERSVLRVKLDTALTNWTYTCNGVPNTINVPIYNGRVPAPTLYIDPGSRLEIDLINNLPVKSPFSGDNCPAGMMATPPNPECFVHTNLHTHGLLVSPCSVARDGSTHCGDATPDQLRCASDDVLVDIPPQSRLSYCIEVPSFHAPGTCWYHSHLHGATGYQVSSGMAGALIIREPAGQELVQADRDLVFVIQEVVPPGTGAFPAVYGRLGSGGGTTTFFVNGLCMPTLEMETGQNMRWRFVNATATPAGLMKLRLIKCGTTCPATPVSWPTGNTTMNLIAVDGLSFYGFPPQPVQAHLMAPGNRADFLMNFSEPGKYMLLKDVFPVDAVSLNSTTNVPATGQQVLAYINVQASSSRETLPNIIPGQRPFYLQAIGKVDGVRAAPVKFQNPAPKQFQIDDNYYGRNKPLEAQLDTAEEWNLQNSFVTSGAGTGIPHPFHIHVNPFQVVRRTIDFETANPRLDPNNPCNWMWMDTVALPGPTTPSVPTNLNIRTRFLVFNGEYVVHCHILVHEDVGMMIKVKIHGNGEPPNKPLREPPRGSVECVERTKARC